MLKIPLDKILTISKHKYLDNWSCLPFKTTSIRINLLLDKLSQLIPNNTCKVMLSVCVVSDDKYVTTISQACKPEDLHVNFINWSNKYKSNIGQHDELTWNLTIIWNDTVDTKALTELFTAIYVFKISDEYLEAIDIVDALNMKIVPSKYCKIDPKIVEEINNSNDLYKLENTPINSDNVKTIAYDDWISKVINDDS